MSVEVHSRFPTFLKAKVTAVVAAKIGVAALKTWMLRLPNRGDGACTALFLLQMVILTHLVGTFGPRGGDIGDSGEFEAVYCLAPVFLGGLFFSRLFGSRLAWWIFVPAFIAAYFVALPMCVVNRIPVPTKDSYDARDWGIGDVSAQHYRIPMMEREIAELKSRLRFKDPGFEMRNGKYVTLGSSDPGKRGGMEVSSYELALGLWREFASTRLSRLEKVVADSTKTESSARAGYLQWTPQARRDYFTSDIAEFLQGSARWTIGVLTTAATLRWLWDSFGAFLRRRRAQRKVVGAK